MRRPERLAESLKEQIAEVVGFELDDPRLVDVTVTDVNVAPDLRDAKVYVLVRGDKVEIDKALTALKRATPFVRQQVASGLEMHHVPQLHFVRDTAGENAERVGEILNTLDIKGESEVRDEMRDEG